MKTHKPRMQRLFITAMFIAVSMPAFATPPSQPGQPIGNVSGSQIQLNWSSSTDDNAVAGYNVYRNNRYVATVPISGYAGTVNVNQPNSFYVVAFDQQDANGQRRFSLRSPESTFNAQSASNTNPAPSADAATQNNTPSGTPTAPSGLKAERTSATTLALSWTPSRDDKGVVGYNVYRNERYLSTVAGPEYTDRQLVAGVQYTYYVVAFDEPRHFSAKSVRVTASTNPSAPVTQPVSSPNTIPSVEPPSGNTPSVDVSTGPDTQRPASVQGVQAITDTNGMVSVSWNPGSDNVGVDGYNVYRNGGYHDTVFTNAYLDTVAPSNQANRYAVVAFDKARNYSARSAYVAASDTTTTTPSQIPSQPSVVSPPLDDQASNNESGDKGTPPTLRDPDADPIASPPRSDPFGSLLEIDTEVSTVGGPPTQPKHVRAELISNDWAEINWAPSNDDGSVVEYRIYRSDGVIYTIREDQTLPNAANQSEIDRFWNSTLFIDCNYTRFYQRVHNCAQTTPNPGDEFTYEISAIDDQGQESARSEPLSIIYHSPQNAPIPYYNDFYKPHNDTFVQEHDLSRVRYFIDEFNEVFADEFDGTSINANYWNTGLVWGDTRIINGEQQYFVNPQKQPNFAYNPFNLTGDTLKIESIPTPENLVDALPSICNEPDPTGKARCSFLSGALSSHDKFGLTYGYVESRMKVGSARGSLSSFYLYNRYPGNGVNLHAPEIDIVEYLGENPFGDELAFQTYHYRNVNDETTNSAPTMSYANPDGTKYDQDFHTFGVLWEPQLVIWYIDGVEIKRMSGPQVSRQQMNIVTYLVSGSAWAPTPDVNADIYPLTLEIDYIKAYQRTPFDTNGVYPE